MKNEIKTTKNVNEANAITHSGIFHADEVFASVILSKLFGTITVFRTYKVPEDVADKIVYDIGNGTLDHHMPEGNGVRENGIPYAAAGLVWKKYGKSICQNTPNPEWIWETIDKVLIQGIDAVDNGVYPKIDYPASCMNISSIIAGFNLAWDSDEDPDIYFEKACEFASQVFDNIFKNCISKAKAKIDVEKAIENSKDHIMILNHFMPCMEYIFSSENHKANDIWFVIYPSSRGGFNWQCVPDEPRSFGQRHPVPLEWKGLRDEELQKVTGVSDAIFCHKEGFIGSAQTLEGAIEMAKKAI